MDLCFKIGKHGSWVGHLLNFPAKRLACYYFFAAQGFLAAHGLAAQGFSAPFAGLPFCAFLAFGCAFTAQGFCAAQGFLAAQGFFAAQGFAWAKLRLGVSKNAAATRASIKRMSLFLIKPSFFTTNCGLV